MVGGSLVRDPEGDPAGFVLILRDITSRKESEKALRLANEDLSHDAPDASRYHEPRFRALGLS